MQGVDVTMAALRPIVFICFTSAVCWGQDNILQNPGNTTNNYLVITMQPAKGENNLNLFDWPTKHS